MLRDDQLRLTATSDRVLEREPRDDQCELCREPQKMLGINQREDGSLCDRSLPPLAPITSRWCVYHEKVMTGLLQPTVYPDELRDTIQRRERERLTLLLAL